MHGRRTISLVLARLQVTCISLAKMKRALFRSLDISQRSDLGFNILEKGAEGLFLRMSPSSSRKPHS